MSHETLSWKLPESLVLESRRIRCHRLQPPGSRRKDQCEEADKSGEGFPVHVGMGVSESKEGETKE